MLMALAPSNAKRLDIAIMTNGKVIGGVLEGLAAVLLLPLLGCLDASGDCGSVGPVFGDDIVSDLEGAGVHRSDADQFVGHWCLHVAF